MRNHEDLEVWQKAHALTIRLYRLAESFPRSEMFGLTSQVRRSAASIGANLAEGCGRWGDAEMARFVQIAMGSAGELQNHLRLARDLGFLDSTGYHSASKDADRRPPDAHGISSIASRNSDCQKERGRLSGEKRRAKSVLMTIGVLALQGDFDAHRKRLEELGAKVTLVRNAEDFDALDGLIIPGGESTTFLKLLGEDTLQTLNDFVHTKPTFGTCAGAIMLAREVENPKQHGLNAIDITIRRNAYGRQIDSSIVEASTRLGSEPLEMVFIRAPRIENVGQNVEVLATRGDDPVLVRQGKVMAATFHPELSQDTRVHQEFLKLVKNGTR
jgi:pyridoxal 5'-phosphate synthase pdxT subunit